MSSISNINVDKSIVIVPISEDDEHIETFDTFAFLAAIKISQEEVWDTIVKNEENTDYFVVRQGQTNLGVVRSLTATDSEILLNLDTIQTFINSVEEERERINSPTFDQSQIPDTFIDMINYQTILLDESFEDYLTEEDETKFSEFVRMNNIILFDKREFVSVLQKYVQAETVGYYEEDDYIDDDEDDDEFGSIFA